MKKLFIGAIIHYRLDGHERIWSVAGEYDPSLPGTMNECCIEFLKRYIPGAEFICVETNPATAATRLVREL